MSVYDQRYQRFIRFLRETRQELGLSQAAVAKRLCKPQTYVSKCELGERRIDFVEALDFAKAYKKDIRYFIRKIGSK